MHRTHALLTLFSISIIIYVRPAHAQQDTTVVPVIGEQADINQLRTDPNRTRLLFGPTARPLEEGSGYAGTFELFFPVAAYGLPGGLSMAIGMSAQPFTWEQLVYLAPKLTVYDGAMADAAVGALYLTTTRLHRGVGVLYGVTTIGRPDEALTLGIGFGYDREQIFNRPAVLIGGEYTIAARTKLITENYVFTGQQDLTIVSVAARTFTRRTSADIGFAVNPGELRHGFPIAPLFNIMIFFGR